MIKRFLSSALGWREGDEYEMLQARLAEHCQPELVPRIAGFFGELLGPPAPDGATPELRAGRNDPQIMSKWLRQTLGDLFAMYAGRGPLLIALDDLHWADAASLDFLSEALRAVHDRPLLVLALARDSFHEQCGRFLAGTPLQCIALGRLTPRAAERLVHAVLGPVDEALLARREQHDRRGARPVRRRPGRCLLLHARERQSYSRAKRCDRSPSS